MSDQPIAAWTGPWKPTAEWGGAYSGVMVDTTEELWDIHDRMPVILHPDEHETDIRLDMEPERDAIYYEQLARVARLKGSATDDPFLAIRLREAAIRHERMARKLRRDSA